MDIREFLVYNFVYKTSFVFRNPFLLLPLRRDLSHHSFPERLLHFKFSVLYVLVFLIGPVLTRLVKSFCSNVLVSGTPSFPKSWFLEVIVT